ncbi:MAG: family transcriptional regulator, cyclic receptor protein [Actinomycetota bacterium]|jgi:CRP-like cAMP-binding protein|nr:family transcriptional regulator, cyclic receptor protein [Actinomycetota bacterium]
MARDNQLDKLAEVPLFSACSRKDLQKIAKASDEVDVKAGRVLVDQGKTGHEFFLILDGNATVRQNNRKVASLTAGDYFGELALLSREPRDATVTADTDMKLLILGQREFTGLIDTVPGLAAKILSIMARRLRQADLKNVRH